VRYRPVGAEPVETTLERVSVTELMAAGPVREFRWYKGRTFYSVAHTENSSPTRFGHDEDGRFMSQRCGADRNRSKRHTPVR
jgi:hypothetical protein